jgi:glutamyl/glutaminyl-tRNA synthetase
MKAMNCRFNPTVDGNLHLGHIYVAAVNEYEAHHSGGQFIIRFDDNQKIWKLRQERREMLTIEKNMIEDFEWLGIKFDLVKSTEAMKTVITKYRDEVAAYPDVHEMVNVLNAPNLIGTDMFMHGYNAELTIEKVIADWIDEIGLLIRGSDLITEFALYSYFCDLWRIPQPIHVYLPRLLDINGREMSKTKGSISIMAMRNKGASMNAVWDLLTDSCLKDPSGNWSIDNIKDEPRLTSEENTIYS